MITPNADAVQPAPTTRLEPRELVAGGRGRLVVTLELPRGVHIQSHTPTEPFLVPTTLELAATGVSLGPVTYPRPQIERFDWTPAELHVYRGVIEFVVPVAIDRTAPAGTRRISGRLRYQACTEHACLPPAEHLVEVALLR